MESRNSQLKYVIENTKHLGITEKYLRTRGCYLITDSVCFIWEEDRNTKHAVIAVTLKMNHKSKFTFRFYIRDILILFRELQNRGMIYCCFLLDDCLFRVFNKRGAEKRNYYSEEQNVVFEKLSYLERQWQRR